MSLDSVATARILVWRETLLWFGYTIDELSIDDDDVALILDILAHRPSSAGVKVTVHEEWYLGSELEPSIPSSEGCQLPQCSWHIDLPTLGFFRLEVDLENWGPNHPLIHAHMPGKPGVRVERQNLGIPEQWLAESEALISEPSELG